jgi:RNA polymerase sigma-70 factor (ECF subfamily)
MLGSAFDAEDAVQETMVRAWRGLGQFDGRSSLRTWLYRIATNVCLDALAARSRRARPIEEGPAGTVDDDLDTRPRTHWLEPIPDVRMLPSDADPFETVALRQRTRLAFVAALQHLPPRQRAALLLSEVLGWSAQEVSGALEMSTAAVNSALQRARATLASRNVSVKGEPLTESQTELLEKYVDAFHEYDVDALVALMREDATLSMPPYTLWLQGPAAIRAWLLGRGVGCRGSRLIRTDACGTPAFAQYRRSPDGSYHAWSLTVLELHADRISAWNAFLDTERLFPLFGLPLTLPSEGHVLPPEGGSHEKNSRVDPCASA